MSSYSCFTTASSSRYSLAFLVAADERVMLQAAFELVQHHEGIDAALAALSVTRALEILSWM